MTGPEPITAPGIHDLDPYTKVTAPKTQAQMKGLGQAMRWKFLADVLYAVSGIEVFGISPFSALSEWADDLVDMAEGALTGANYANAQLGSLTSNIEGGLSASAKFNGAESAGLGGSWDVESTGAGAGTFGPNGFGRAVWKKSGGLSRTHNYRWGTESIGDYQVIQVLLGELPQAPIGLDAAPFTYLTGRVNDAHTSYVYARLGRTTLTVGCVVSGTDHVFAVVPIPGGNQAGNVWRFQCGKAVWNEISEDYDYSPRTFAVYRNGVQVWRDTDGSAVSQVGEDYRGVGLIAEATARFFFTDQSAPAEIDVWSAADFLAA